MRPGQPPSRIVYVVSCLPLSPLRGGTTASARQRSKGVPHLPKPVADHDFKIMISRSMTLHHKSATAAVASGPVCSEEQSKGRRPQTPGQPVRAFAFFWNVPRQFTLENHRLPLARPQSFGELRNSHVSLNPLSATLL